MINDNREDANDVPTYDGQVIFKGNFKENRTSLMKKLKLRVIDLFYFYIV